ncbi:hypothetical protein Tco_0200324 [Tanacetum coccineum]
MNNDAPVIGATPLSSVYPSNIVENVADSDDPSYREDKQTLVGQSLPPHLVASKKLKILGKRKVASGVSRKALPPKVQKVHVRASKVAEFPSAKELRDATDYHWVVAHAVLDNVLNSRTRELISTLHKAKTSYDAIRARELDKDRAYAELERKLKSKEVDILKQDRAVVVSKVIPDAAMKLVRGDDLCVLIAKLVKSSIIYGRYQAFEEVAAMEEPFVLEKMSGYRPSSKEEYDRAGDALANASYLFLDEYVVNPYASLEQLLSKKPPSLRPILF